MACILRSGKVLLTRAATTTQRSAHTRSLPFASPQLQFAAVGKSTLRSAGPAKLLGTRSARLSTTVFASSTVMADSVYDFTVKDIDGNKVDMRQYEGKVVLVVNVASQCGFTSQYKEMAALYNKYKDQGFVILGFPCNQFGGQEPADNEKIKKFAQDRGAQFPMMAKVDVNGSKAEPLYSFLKSKQKGVLVSDIKWNFSKFLVSHTGEVVKRYGSATTPFSIEDDIKALL